MGSGAPNYVDWAIWELLSGLGLGAACLGWPIGAGHVYWVDATNGNDGNTGTRPDQAFATITFALTQCVDERNDYIMVIDAWQEAATVTVNVTKVHILGVGAFMRLGSNTAFTYLSAGGDWPIFTIGSAGNRCEIGGFLLGGGATHAGIENPVGVGTPMGIHIHDCVFGHQFCANTPQDGILISQNATNIRIEHNVFLGAPTGKGTLTRDGVRWAAAGDPLNGVIENNKFMGLPGIGLNMAATPPATGGFIIQDNVFECGGDVQGSAITLAAAFRGCLVVGNKAMYGQLTAGMANNPYLDNATVAPFNAWAGNYKGNALVDPA
jgi:hypothetical protein